MHTNMQLEYGEFGSWQIQMVSWEQVIAARDRADKLWRLWNRIHHIAAKAEWRRKKLLYQYYKERENGRNKNSSSDS